MIGSTSGTPRSDRLALSGLLLASLALAGCSHRGQDGSTGPIASPGEIRELFAPEQPRALEQPLRVAEATEAFYEQREFVGVWTPDLARRLVDTLKTASEHGLSPLMYPTEAIDLAVKRGQASAELEALCTDAFLAFAAHMTFGRINSESLEPDWRVRRKTADMTAVLDRALETGEIAKTLTGLAPRHPGYAALVAGLRAYRGYRWGQLPGAGALAVGARGETVRALRTRLAAEGYISTEGSEQDRDEFDSGLEAAIKSFQIRNGLPHTGIVADRTRAALNISPEQRVQQIAANLERWRWLPEDLGGRHIMVNVPDFRLAAIDAGRTALEMKVIVGRTYRKTPVFSGDLFEVVLNPGWGVPRRIATEDKLPLIKKDPSYLAKSGMKVYRGDQEVDPKTIDWKSVSKNRFPYQLRQSPGPGNALGQIKFNIENEFDVYLHDTPDRQLFSGSERALSSGCVRVEKPIALAEHVLDGTQWSAERIERVLRGATTTRIKPRQPIRVHLEYWTAWADEMGQIQFRPDIYQRDQRLISAMAGASTPTPLRQSE